MIVMVANSCGGKVHFLAGRYNRDADQIGWILAPGDGGFKEPRKWLPYAVDNGKFSAWSAKRAPETGSK